MPQIRIKLEPSSIKDGENIYLLSDGEYTMCLSEKDIMLVLVSAKHGGIYLDVDKEIYSQAINDALQVIDGCSESGSYDHVESLLET